MVSLRVSRPKGQRKIRLHQGISIGTTLAIIATMLAVIHFASDAQAVAPIPFTVKKQIANETGAIETIGNRLVTCSGMGTGTSQGKSCDTALGGTVGNYNAGNNNDYIMIDLDVDGNSGFGSVTHNSSSADLLLPTNAEVEWAGLYWGGRLAGPVATGGHVGDPSKINTMKLMLPGDTSYRDIAASTAARDQFGPGLDNDSFQAYQRFADVTSLVQAAGNGTYWGGNVETSTRLCNAAATCPGTQNDSHGTWAGWALVIIYKDTSLPPRNITVFDGFVFQDALTHPPATNSDVNIHITGFQAPPTNDVVTGLTMVVYEGDSTTGDSAKLCSGAGCVGKPLGTSVSPSDNFFNSSINILDGSNSVTNLDRNPNSKNNLGFDIKNLQVTGAIENNATEATFTFATNGDRYYPGVLGIYINLYEPDFSTSTKTVINRNGNNPSRPGDTLTYVITYRNTGLDPATHVVSNDPIPANTAYVANSLRLVNPGAPTAPTPNACSGTVPPNTVPCSITDGASDDVGEYTSGTNSVTVRLGQDATATTGGTIDCVGGTGCGSKPTTQSYAFDVVVQPSASATTLRNRANLTYDGTLDPGLTYGPLGANTDVADVADVGITKTMDPHNASIGDTVTATLDIVNNGPGPAPNTTITDAIPSGWSNVTVQKVTPNPASACTVSGTPPTLTQSGVAGCNVGTLASGATAQVVLSGTITTTASSITNTAQVKSDAIDTNLRNNASSDTVNLSPVVDLGVVKSAVPNPAQPPSAGQTVTWTATVTNYGPAAAQNVVITDQFDVPTQGTLTAATISTANNSTDGTPAPACTISGSSPSIVTCNVANLDSGATATIQLTSVLAAGLPAGETVQNDVKVTSSTPEAPGDPTTCNSTGAPEASGPHANCATATVTTGVPQPDVSSVKNVVAPSGGANAVAGGPIAWQIVSTNNGPADAGMNPANPIVITDTVPAGVTVTAVLTTRGTCTTPLTPYFPAPAGTVITCTVTNADGGLPNGASMTVSLIGNVANDYDPANGPIVNTANVNVPGDPTPNNPTAPPVTVVGAYDLTIEKTADRSSLPLGTPTTPLPVNYNLRIINTQAGPSTAHDITVTDDLSQAEANGLHFVSVGTLPAGTICGVPNASNILTCTVDQLARGAYVDIPVTLVTDQDLATPAIPITNTATVIPRTGDVEDPSNNTDTWTLSGAAQPDLQVLKSGPSSVVAGSNIPATGTDPYTFTLNNLPIGTPPENISVVKPTITDTLPAGVTWDGTVSWDTVAHPGTTVTCNPIAGTNPQQLSCQWDGSIPSGDTFEFSIGANFSPNMSDYQPDGTGRIINTADGLPESPEVDPNLSNNHATWPTVITASADVTPALTITGGPTTCPAVGMGPGSQRTINIQLNNSGPSTAGNVTFRLQRLDWAANADLSSAVVQTSWGGSVSLDLSKCSNLATELECSLPTDVTTGLPNIPPGGSVNIVYPVTIDPSLSVSSSTGDVLHDRLTVSTTTPESNVTNNVVQDPSSSVIPPGPNTLVCAPTSALSVTKTALNTVANPWEPGKTLPYPGMAGGGTGHQSFIAGGQFTYQIAVQVPSGPNADVQNGTIDDLLPRGMSATSVSLSSTTGSCTVTPLDPNVPVTDPAGYEYGSTVAGTVSPLSTLHCQGLYLQGGGAPSTVIITVTGTLDPNANDLSYTGTDDDNFAEGIQNNVLANGQTLNGTPLSSTCTLPAEVPAGPGSPGPIPASWPTTGAACASAVNDIIESADLKMQKGLDGNDDAMIAGGTLGYALTITNGGPSGVEHAVITDQLPPGFTVDLTDPANADCVPVSDPPVDPNDGAPLNIIPTVDGGTSSGYGWTSSNVLTAANGYNDPLNAATKIACYVGPMNLGASQTIHIVAKSPANQPASSGVTNTAVAGSLAYDPYWSDSAHDAPEGNNNLATVTVPVKRITDVAVTITPPGGPLVDGTYTTINALSVNKGPSSSTNTVGWTQFPPGFIPSQVNIPYNVCTWHVDGTGTPPAGAPTDGSSFAGTWSAAPYDPNYSYSPNIQYSLSCVPQYSADGSLWSDTNPVPAQWEAGGQATNSITVFVPADTPPGSVNGNNAPYAASTWIGTSTPEVDWTGGPGNTADPSYGANSCDRPTGITTFAGALVDCNNLSTINFTLQANSDTVIDKQPDPDINPGPPVAGAPYTWLMKVWNNGPSVAQHTTVSDTLPAGMTYSSAYPAEYTHDATPGSANWTECAVPSITTGGVVVQGCDVGTLAVSPSKTGTEAGTWAFVRVTYIIDPDQEGQTQCNLGLVGSLGPGLDPDGSNNLDGSCSPATGLAKLDIHKSATPTVNKPGAPETWTLVVHNDGPSVARNTVVTDALLTAGQGTLTGATVSSYTGTGAAPASCSVTGGTITCAPTDMWPNDEMTIQVTGVLAAGLTDLTVVNNQAAVTSITLAADGLPAHAEDVASVLVRSLPALSITKTSDVASARPGDPVSWTIQVINTGTGVAAPVSIVDSLGTPAWITLTGATVASSSGATNPSCAGVTDTGVNCRADQLASGGTITIKVTGTISTSAPTGVDVVNNATVTSPTDPGGPGSPGHSDDSHIPLKPGPGGPGSPTPDRPHPATGVPIGLGVLASGLLAAALATLVSNRRRLNVG